jgi:DNA-binding NarL/FixJ family response regulator
LEGSPTFVGVDITGKLYILSASDCKRLIRACKHRRRPREEGQVRERRHERRAHKPSLGFYQEDVRARLATCGLTPRQQQVVELVLQGLTNREIAAALRIEEYTVKVHLRDIFYRLKIQRRTSLMLKVFHPIKEH